MNKELLNYIETMSAKLGVAAEHLYAILVRQSYVSAITELITLAIFLVVSGYAFYFCYKKYWKTQQEKNWSDEDQWFVSSIILGIVFGIVVIIALFVIPDAIGRFINPEYYAIKELLEVAKGD
jgi:uncharacterized membrane-anchored protein